MDGYVVVDGGSDSHSLRPAELEHRLHILAEEGSLYRHLVGQIGVDDASHPLENPAESQVGIFLLAHVDDTHHHQFCLVADDAYHAIAHHVGAGVNAQDDFLCVRFLLNHLNAVSSESLEF